MSVAAQYPACAACINSPPTMPPPPTVPTPPVYPPPRLPPSAPRPPGLPPRPPAPPVQPIGSTCRLIYGVGDCSESNFCSGVGKCNNGLCECPPNYIDANCSMRMLCKFWDESSRSWSSVGVNSSLSAEGSLSCSTTHLTTFGGIIEIPTSADELLAELEAAVQFNTLSLDEISSLLQNFDFGDNPTIMTCVISLIVGDLITLLFLGWYRGSRARIRRKRKNEMFQEERELDSIREIRAKLKKLDKQVPGIIEPQAVQRKPLANFGLKLKGVRKARASSQPSDKDHRENDAIHLARAVIERSATRSRSSLLMGRSKTTGELVQTSRQRSFTKRSASIAPQGMSGPQPNEMDRGNETPGVPSLPECVDVPGNDSATRCESGAPPSSSAVQPPTTPPPSPPPVLPLSGAPNGADGNLVARLGSCSREGVKAERQMR